jgi:hypothetical protein
MLAAANLQKSTCPAHRRMKVRRALLTSTRHGFANDRGQSPTGRGK